MSGRCWEGCWGEVSGRCVREVSGRCVGCVGEVCQGGVSGRCVGVCRGWNDVEMWEEGWRPVTHSALLSGYLGKSGHLPRFKHCIAF